MKRIILWVGFSLLLASAAWADECQQQDPSSFTDSQIRWLLIGGGHTSNEEPCQCPWDRDVDGSVCGERSAYCRPNGDAPVCYESDVSDETVQAWRDAHTD